MAVKIKNNWKLEILGNKKFFQNFIRLTFINQNRRARFSKRYFDFFGQGKKVRVSYIGRNGEVKKSFRTKFSRKAVDHWSSEFQYDLDDV